MVCEGNLHEIEFDDAADPSGSQCKCGEVSIFSAVSTVREGVIGISVIVSEGGD